MPSPHFEAGQSPEEQIEWRCDFIVRELDELCAMATSVETIDLVESERHSIGVMKTRIDLILSFLLARQSPRLRIVRNG